MLKKSTLLMIYIIVSSSTIVQSFTVVNRSSSSLPSLPSSLPSRALHHPQQKQSSTNLALSLLDNIDTSSSIQALHSTSTYLSTISADIDNIPQDEFAKVFAGGIVVMIGGVFSAVMVGFLLESNNSYASVVADSYAQGGDEEFWDSLSPEDQVKAKELIKKLKASKGEVVDEDVIVVGGGASGASVDVDVDVEKKSSLDGVVEQKQNEKKADAAVSMFSDYD